MFLRIVLACAAVGLLLPPLAPASQPPPQARLAADVTRAIQSCPQMGIFDEVMAEVEDGTVVLTGRVTTPEKRTEIGSRTARVPGVLSVRNEIGVLPSSAEDDDLRYRIARALYGHPAFWSHAARPHPPVHILVEDGHVTLTGVIDTPAERALAASLASGLGERSLTNRLRVRGQCRASRC